MVCSRKYNQTPNYTVLSRNEVGFGLEKLGLGPAPWHPSLFHETSIEPRV